MSEPNIYYYTILFAEYFTCFVAIILSGLLWKRYKERKNEVALLLFKAFIFLAPAAISQSFDEFFFNDYFYDLYGYRTGVGFSMAFILSAVSNLYILRFYYDIFFKEKSRVPNLLGSMDIIACIIFGVFRFPEMHSIAQYFLIIHVLLSWIIYGRMFYLSLNISKKLTEKIDKASFIIIGSYGIFLSIMYIIYVYDFIMNNAGSYTLLPALAWFCGIIGIFCAFIGFTRPKWFSRMFSHQ